MVDEIADFDQLMAAANANSNDDMNDQNDQHAQKPSSIFKTDMYVKNNHNFRPDSVGGITGVMPPFGFD